MADKARPELKTPQWLHDFQSQASKECPSFSLSDELQNIHGAKKRGEDPLKTVFRISDEDLEKYSLSDELQKIHEAKKRGQDPLKTVYRSLAEKSMVKQVETLRIQSAEHGDRTRVREEQRSSVIDGAEDEEARDAWRRANVQKRKASRSSDGDSLKVSRKARKVSNSAFSPAEEPVAESSKTGVARRPSATLDRPFAEISTAEVINPAVNDVYEPKTLPDWLKSIQTATLNRELKRPDKDQTQALRSIEAFKDCIRRWEDTAATDNPDNKILEELRDHVHKAEILLKGVDKFVVRKTNMLTVVYGLPRIFASRKMDCPWDLKADAWQLYLRWYRQDFKPDLLRGIVTRKGKDRSSDSIDPEWAKDPSLKIPANYHGQGHLVLGQWWPTQLCAVRDGAHGAPQGGIWGAKGKGAYSIVLSGSGYKDKDDGNEIWYSGTDKKDFNPKDPTENTKRLIESHDDFPDQPVRVLRSSQLSASNPYRPKYGLRYDGLYTVVGKVCLDESKQEYTFKLLRCDGQYPIRCENNAARRPTKFEEEEFLRLKNDGR